MYQKMPFATDTEFKNGFSAKATSIQSSSGYWANKYTEDTISSNYVGTAEYSETSSLAKKGKSLLSKAKDYIDELADFGIKLFNGDYSIKYPAAPGNGIIMGLPFHMTSASSDPMLHNIFINSFPIMRVKPFKIKRSDNSTDFEKESDGDIPGGEYKFAIMNEGGAGFSINNEFGPCVLENQFNEVVNNSAFSFLGEMNQMAQSNSIMGPTIAGAYRQATGAAGGALEKILANARESLSGLGNSGIQGGAKDLGNAGINVVDMFGKALINGSRIDIPNIWKGSSGGHTASIKIRLRSRFAGSYDGSDADEDFRNQILEPLKILLLLSCPRRMTSGDVNGGGATYQNPPYLEVTIDKVFESKLCAIKNMSVQFDYMRESYYSNKPLAADVTLQLEDMYQVIVCDDNKLYTETKPPDSDNIPSGERIIGNLNDKDHNNEINGLKDSLIQGNINKKFGDSYNPDLARMAEYGYEGNAFNPDASHMAEYGYSSSGNVLGSSSNSIIKDLSGLNDIRRASEATIDQSWFKCNYSFNYDNWQILLNQSAQTDKIFENAWFKYNSGGGFDFGAYATVNLTDDVQLNLGGVLNQSYGNFNLGAKMNINVGDIITIPVDISSSYFNGVRSEIRDYVPKIIINESSSSVFTDPVSLIRDNIQVESDDDVKKLDKIYNVKYSKYNG